MTNEHDAQVLRDAAEALNVDAVGFRPGWGSGNGADLAAMDALLQAINWLRDRADRLEEQQ